jgi:hypothetical protein
MYWPITPRPISWAPPIRSRTTITDVQPSTVSSVKNRT